MVEEQLRTENARLKRQLAEQAEELAIINKAATYFAKSLKYVFIRDHSGQFKVTTMSRVLKASRSGYYRWKAQGEQPTAR